MSQGRIEVVSLVCHLRLAHKCCLSAWHDRAAGRRSDRQCPLVGVTRRVQLTPSALYLAKVIPHHHAQTALADPSPLGASRGERTLGVCEPTAQPLDKAQIPLGYRPEHPVVLTYLGEGP
jgi:hypothetical protein